MSGRLLEACPDDLVDPVARSEWARVTGDLTTRGQVTSLDRATLIGYCLKYGQWKKLEDEARKHPFIVRSKAGNPIPNPALEMASKCFAVMMKAASELGITPASRARVSESSGPPVSDRSLSELARHLDKPDSLEATAIRREYVAHEYYVKRKTARQIREDLLHEEPPIKLALSTIYRDVYYLRTNFRKHYASGTFDPSEMVAAAFASYHESGRMAYQAAEREAKKTNSDGVKLSSLLRSFNDSVKASMDLAQDVGLINRNIGTLFVRSDPGKTAQALPTGAELAARFRAVRVDAETLVSEAEKAWAYGDEGASNAAALDEAQTIDVVVVTPSE